MPKYRVVVDHGLCQGHSVCIAEASELFRLVDKGEAYPQAVAIHEDPPEELLAKAETAEELCPNGAIKIIYLDD